MNRLTVAALMLACSSYPAKADLTLDEAISLFLEAKEEFEESIGEIFDGYTAGLGGNVVLPDEYMGRRQNAMQWTRGEFGPEISIDPPTVSSDMAFSLFAEDQRAARRSYEDFLQEANDELERLRRFLGHTDRFRSEFSEVLTYLNRYMDALNDLYLICSGETYQVCLAYVETDAEIRTVGELLSRLDQTRGSYESSIERLSNTIASAEAEYQSLRILHGVDPIPSILAEDIQNSSSSFNEFDFESSLLDRLNLSQDIYDTINTGLEREDEMRARIQRQRQEVLENQSSRMGRSGSGSGAGSASQGECGPSIECEIGIEQ